VLRAGLEGPAHIAGSRAEEVALLEVDLPSGTQWRVSSGSAAVLGLRPLIMDAAPTTAYLMVGERCRRNCAFCAQARESRAPVLERLESAESPITQTLWRDWANLEKTIQSISVEDAQRATEALRSARSIYIIAEGVGIGLAVIAQGYLKMLKPDVFVLGQGPFDTAMELKELTPQDVVIGIGYTSYAYAATRALQFANRVGALTIGIIGQADCPIATQAKLLFACSVTEKGYLPSPTCPGAILFAFIYNLYMGDPDTYNRKLIQFQELYADLTEGTARGDEEVVDDLLGLF